MSYQNQGWFALLQSACASHARNKVATMLGVSAPLLSQVLNASGKYGSGQASTTKLAERVVHTFGRFDCPHLSAQSADAVDVNITADQCRTFAHRPAPTASPRELQHWQACQKCPHKAHTAPPQPREVKPRKGRTAPNPSWFATEGDPQ